MSTCAFPECPNEARTRGFCHAHYQQWWKTGAMRDLGRSHNRRDDVIDQIERSLPITAESAATQLGYGRVHSLYRTLHRAGRDDLWRRMREAA